MIGDSAVPRDRVGGHPARCRFGRVARDPGQGRRLRGVAQEERGPTADQCGEAEGARGPQDEPAAADPLAHDAVGAPDLGRSGDRARARAGADRHAAPRRIRCRSANSSSAAGGRRPQSGPANTVGTGIRRSDERAFERLAEAVVTSLRARNRRCHRRLVVGGQALIDQATARSSRVTRSTPGVAPGSRACGTRPAGARVRRTRRSPSPSHRRRSTRVCSRSATRVSATSASIATARREQLGDRDQRRFAPQSFEMQPRSQPVREQRRVAVERGEVLLAQCKRHRAASDPRRSRRRPA